MADLEADFDEQDQAEVYDEDNISDMDRGPGEDPEQFEDLVALMDVTSAVGDSDDDDAVIGEELDDAGIVAAASDEEDEDDAELRAADYEDEIDGVTAREGDEVELEYIGDLDDLAGAASAAQSMEADSLSDEDLRELDYKDEFTVDEDEDAPA